ncbi:MAG: hypothetical protein J5636_07155 [Clostridiales bacterium]|nr:hypothetical protein [Clostridiales bacterium]
MATLCKNCAAPLVFDPLTQKVVCRSCGSSWDAEEVESREKELLREKHAESAVDVYGEEEAAAREFLDCYVYLCSSCGGEIIINGTESSTKCIYCGSSSVVFDRIAKEKAPEFIIPFAISKEQAIAHIEKAFKHGMFIPKEIKTFKPEAVRGIYIPYWIANAYHTEADIFRGETGSGKNRRVHYYARSGRMTMTNIPVDASMMLSDESSQCLEPFDFSALKYFDEDYLLGFYSNVSDIKNQDLTEVVFKRTRNAFQTEAKKSIKNAHSITLIDTRSQTIVDRDVKYAMLPVWFVTYDYEGRHNTIMVNGQTGKVVCGVPWNQKLFSTICAILATILTAINTTIFAKYVVPPILYSQAHRRSGSRNNPISVIVIIITFGLGVFAIGAAFYKNVKKHLQLSQSASIFNFMKKRQE